MGGGQPGRKPSAKERTVSLFTGKTDIEDPYRGRDGTLGELPRSVPKTREPIDRGFHYVPGPVPQNSPLKSNKKDRR